MVPAAEIQGVADQYGVNKTRFWVKPQNCTGSLLFNNANPLFRNNVPLRKAINWAVDRTDYAGVAGPVRGLAVDAPDPAGLPRLGVEDAQAVRGEGQHPEGEGARGGALPQRAHRRHLPRPRLDLPGQADLVRRDLIRLGFDPAKIDMRGVARTRRADYAAG